MSLVQFHSHLKRILGRAGYSQQQLAGALNLHSTLLSNKLLGVRKGRLTNLDIKNIILTLAKWEAIYSQKEVLELLAELGLPPAFIGKDDWNSYPLNHIEMLPAVPPNLPTGPGEGSGFARNCGPAAPLNPALIQPLNTTSRQPTSGTGRLSNGQQSTTRDASAKPGLPLSNSPILNPMTRLIGREELLTELAGVMSQKEARLVSLIGPGGIGKTRVALAIARQKLSRLEFKDGVYFVELDKLNSSELVVRTIAETLSLRDRMDNTPPFEILSQFLKEREILIILDNFEHVTEAAPQLGELLSIAPKLKFLVTSRVNLGIYGEWEFIVPPLPLPNFLPDSPADTAYSPPAKNGPYPKPGMEDLPVIALNPAIALFLERTRAIDHRLTLTPQNVNVVVKICRLLEGFPLALELAAARTRLFGFDGLLDHLQNSYLHVLNHGQVKLRKERHRSLQASLDWSYNLLNADEQKLFCRLALFKDGFDIETVQAIVPLGGLGLGIELFEGLENLLNKSLLTGQEASPAILNSPTGGEGGLFQKRYRMLQPIREYALEHLKDWQNDFWQDTPLNPSTSVIEPVSSGWALPQDYCRYWVNWVKKEVDHLEKTGDRASFNRLRREYANIRDVLEAALKHKALETALALIGPLSFYLNWQSQFNEWLSYLEPVLSLDSDALSEDPELLGLRGNLLFWSGFLAIAQMDIAKTKRRIQESLKIFRTLNDKTWIARNLNCLGFVETSAGNTLVGLNYLYESLEIRREEGEGIAIANGLGNLGVGLINNNNDSAALAALEEALALFRANNYELGLATLYTKEISYIAIHRGDLEVARRYLEDGISLALKINNDEALHYARTMYGIVYFKQGQPEAARESLKEGLEIAYRIGDNFGILHNLAVYPAVLLELAHREAGLNSAGKEAVLKAVCLLEMLENLLKEKGIVLPPMFCELTKSALAGAKAELGTTLCELSYQNGRQANLKKTVEFVLTNV